ncbi:MAG: hypothetical protein AABW72_01265 [archaeon]
MLIELLARLAIGDFDYVINNLLLNNLGWAFIFLLATQIAYNKISLKGLFVISIWLISLADIFTLLGIISPATNNPLIYFPFACTFSFFTAGAKIAKHTIIPITLNLILLGFIIKFLGI